MCVVMQWSAWEKLESALGMIVSDLERIREIAGRTKASAGRSCSRLHWPGRWKEEYNLMSNPISSKLVGEWDINSNFKGTWMK